MPRTLSTAAATVALLALCALAAAQPPTETNGASEAEAAGQVDFNRDIRPIFVAHCTACHGGVKQAGDLSFVYPEQVLPPDGWIVEPGDPGASALIERVTETDPDLRMPPPDHGPALSEREVQRLSNWVAQGATWREHWSLEKPTRPAPPADDVAEAPEAKAHAEWPRADLDRFILARLEQEGLGPSADAAPHHWLRRVSLDLVGLPPTPAELDAFLADVAQRGEAAYTAAVDRLLDSPHFGERWASVWLDQVRYADSKGLGHDGPRNAWKFRDWVIDAFNDDLPYDRFLVKQLAGDLLPEPTADDLIATVCCRLTQSNEEGGTDDEEFRVAAVLDRVSTTWQAWQGITFGCVQCHSHPYDPIRHDEFYRFVAFFNNTADSDVPSDLPHFRAPVDRSEHDHAARLDRQIRELREALWRSEEATAVSDEGLWEPVRDLSAEANRETKVALDNRAGRVEFHTVGAVAAKTDITLECAPPADGGPITGVRVTASPLDPASAAADSEWGFVWSHVRVEVVGPDAPADTKSDDPSLTTNDPTTNDQATDDGGPAPDGQAAVEAAEDVRTVQVARVVGDEPHPLLDPAESLNPKSEWGYGAYSRIHRPRRATLVLAEPVTLGETQRLRVTLVHRSWAADASTLTTRRGHVDLSDSPQLTGLLDDPELARQHAELAALEDELAGIETVDTPILRERPASMRRPTHVFIRGLFLDKGDQVTPGTPDSFPPLAADGEPSRLDLAEWFVSDDNPLTARVAVNRFWARLFGVGLVETEEDFGSSGEPPSHPELLDHLAVRFQHDLGWSVKALLREVVLSSTYRQTAKVGDGLHERDPSNRLLARGPRVRLPAETVRDQALAAAGLLDRAQHGPPVRPPLADGVWKPFYRDDLWPKSEPGDSGRYRRSIYTYHKRSIPYPMFAVFDSPSREFCTPRRLRSNTPLQALQMLNSEAMAECAVALAERMREHDPSDERRIVHGFRAALCREPTSREAEILESLRVRSEGDGLEAVAAALLNLDEFVMK